ncbi:hypothetical protein Tco_1353988 [Tanacetum coccineum]
MLGARELITNPTAARAAIWVEAWLREVWNSEPRRWWSAEADGGGDRRGGRGGDRRGGIGDGRRDSRGRRYGPGSGSKGGKFELMKLTDETVSDDLKRALASGPILTGSLLLASVFKARKDDERHQESR